MTHLTQTRPACPLQARRCGGCPQLGVPYAQQLAAKQRRAETLFVRFAPVAPILGADDPFHYRNKAIASFAQQGGQAVAGIYAAGTHRVLPLPAAGCLLQAPILDKTIAAAVSAVRAVRWPVYDEDRGTGLVRHLLVRCGHASGQVMVVLVAASDRLPGSRRFVEELRRAAPWVTTVVHNHNPRRTSAVLGRNVRTLYGPGFIRDSLCGLTFRLSARSFYQINPPQTQRLYEAAVAAANLTGRELVMDAYCGTGTIGLIAAAHAGQVLGVERSREAVRDAEANARRNGVRNIRFLCADAGEQMARWAADARRPDVVLLDPPRAGCSPQFLQALMHMGPKRTVYISCDPETQARDLAVLCDAYRVMSLQPVDLFPHTRHIECIAALEKRV